MPLSKEKNREFILRDKIVLNNVSVQGEKIENLLEETRLY